MDAEGIILSIGADNSGLKQTVESSESTVKSFARTVEDSDSSMRGYKEASDQADSSLRGYKQATEQADQASKSFGDHLKDLGQIGLGVQAIAGGFHAVGDAVSNFLGEALEAERGTAQLEARLQSTGGAAGMTKQAVLDLAGNLSAGNGLSRATDDAVLAGENMLLTFTNIHSNVFPATTQAVLDVATAMNQGAAPSAEQLSAQATQLGKALNDPTQGLSALTKIGVTFTDGQKEQIKTLQANGDMMGAQKIILAELSNEFGGSAAASAQTFEGKLDSLGAKFDDVKQAAGERLLPMVEDVIDAFNSPEGDKAIKGFGDMASGAVGTVVDAFKMAGPVIEPVFDFLTDNSAATGIAIASMFGVMAVAAVAAAAPTLIALAPVIVVMAAVGAAAFALKVAWDNNFMGMRQGPQMMVDGAIAAFEMFKKGLLGVAGFIEPWIDNVGGLWQKFTAFIKGETIKAGDEFKSNLTQKIIEASSGVETTLLDLHDKATQLMGDAGADAAQAFSDQIGAHAASERQDALDMTRQDMQDLATDAATLGANTGANWLQNFANQFDANKAAIQTRIDWVNKGLALLGTMDSNDSSSTTELRERNLIKQKDKLNEQAAPYGIGPDVKQDKTTYVNDDSAAKKHQADVAKDQAASDKKRQQDQNDAAAAAKKNQDAANAASLQPFEASVYHATTAVDMAKTALNNATAAIQPFKDAADQAQSKVDGLQREIALAERGLRPYQQAVTDATKAQDEAKAKLAEAQEGLAPYQQEIDAAQGSVHDLEIQIRHANEALQPFKDAVSAAQAEVTKAQAALDQASQKLVPYQQEIDKSGERIADMQANIREATWALDPFKQNVAKAGDALAAANADLQDSQNQLKEYQSELSNAQSALQSFQQAPLQGSQAFSDKLFENSQAVAKLQYELNNLKLNGGSEEQMKALTDQIDKLNLEGQQIKLQEQLQLDPLRRQLEAVGNTAHELTFAEAMAGANQAAQQIQQMQAAIAATTAQVHSYQSAQDAAQYSLDAANAALKTQQEGVDQLSNALEKEQRYQQAAKDTLERMQRTLVPYQDALDGAKNKLDLANKALADQQEKIEPLNKALEVQKSRLADANDAYDAANKKLDPYRQAVTDAGKAVDTANAALQTQKDKLDPLYTALSNANDELADAKYNYGQAQASLKPYNDAVAEAQTNLDNANKALSDHKDALDPVKKQYMGINAELREWEQHLANLGGYTPSASSDGKPSGQVIPAFANGGIVTGATKALVGEAGPEAIMPLSKLPGIMASALAVSRPAATRTVETRAQGAGVLEIRVLDNRIEATLNGKPVRVIAEQQGQFDKLKNPGSRR